MELSIWTAPWDCSLSVLQTVALTFSFSFWTELHGRSPFSHDCSLLDRRRSITQRAKSLRLRQSKAEAKKDEALATESGGEEFAADMSISSVPASPVRDMISRKHPSSFTTLSEASWQSKDNKLDSAKRKRYSRFPKKTGQTSGTCQFFIFFLPG